MAVPNDRFTVEWTGPKATSCYMQYIIYYAPRNSYLLILSFYSVQNGHLTVQLHFSVHTRTSFVCHENVAVKVFNVMLYSNFRVIPFTDDFKKSTIHKYRDVYLISFLPSDAPMLSVMHGCLVFPNREI